MTRSRSITTSLVVIAVAVFLSACAPTASADPSAGASSPEAPAPPTVAAERTPIPAAPAVNDVDPAAFADEIAGGVTFGVADGDVNCQIIEVNGELQWGCAVHSRPTWTWDETQFAEYCASLDDGGCRNGLVVRGDEAPQPRRNTDVAFGGMQSPNALATNERLTIESVSCTPEGDGVLCEDARSGHGFTLSAADIDAW